MATPPQNDNMTHSNAPLNFRHTDTLITTKVPHYPTKVTTGMSIIPGWNRPNANGQNANINDKDYNGPDFKARPLKHWRKQLRVYDYNGPANNSRTASISELERPGTTVYHFTPDCACVPGEGGNSYIISNNKFGYETKNDDYSKDVIDVKIQNNGYVVVPYDATEQQINDPTNPAYKILTGVYNTDCINCSPQGNLIRSGIALQSQAYYSYSNDKLESRCQTFEQNISTNKATGSVYFDAQGIPLWPNDAPNGPQVVAPVNYGSTIYKGNFFNLYEYIYNGVAAGSASNVNSALFTPKVKCNPKYVVAGFYVNAAPAALIEATIYNSSNMVICKSINTQNSYINTNPPFAPSFNSAARLFHFPETTFLEPSNSYYINFKTMNSINFNWLEYDSGTTLILAGVLVAEPLYCPSQTIYKPNNIAFAKQGAVSGSARLKKLVSDTVTMNGSSFYSARGAEEANLGRYQGTNISGNYYLKNKPVTNSCLGTIPTAPIVFITENDTYSITFSWREIGNSFCGVEYYTVTYYAINIIERIRNIEDIVYNDDMKYTQDVQDVQETWDIHATQEFLNINEAVSQTGQHIFSKNTIINDDTIYTDSENNIKFQFASEIQTMNVAPDAKNIITSRVISSLNSDTDYFVSMTSTNGNGTSIRSNTILTNTLTDSNIKILIDPYNTDYTFSYNNSSPVILKVAVSSLHSSTPIIVSTNESRQNVAEISKVEGSEYIYEVVLYNAGTFNLYATQSKGLGEFSNYGTSVTTSPLITVGKDTPEFTTPWNIFPQAALYIGKTYTFNPAKLTSPLLVPDDLFITYTILNKEGNESSIVTFIENNTKILVNSYGSFKIKATTTETQNYKSTFIISADEYSTNMNDPLIEISPSFVSEFTYGIDESFNIQEILFRFPLERPSDMFVTYSIIEYEDSKDIASIDTITVTIRGAGRFKIRAQTSQTPVYNVASIDSPEIIIHKATPLLSSSWNLFTDIYSTLFVGRTYNFNSLISVLYDIPDEILPISYTISDTSIGNIPNETTPEVIINNAGEFYITATTKESKNYKQSRIPSEISYSISNAPRIIFRNDFITKVRFGSIYELIEAEFIYPKRITNIQGQALLTGSTIIVNIFQYDYFIIGRTLTADITSGGGGGGGGGGGSSSNSNISATITNKKIEYNLSDRTTRYVIYIGNDTGVSSTITNIVQYISDPPDYYITYSILPTESESETELPVASISGTKVTINKAGTFKIRAQTNQPSTVNGFTLDSEVITVEKDTPIIKLNDLFDFALLVGNTYLFNEAYITYPNNIPSEILPIKYISLNPDIVSIDVKQNDLLNPPQVETSLTVKRRGNFKIRAETTMSANYNVGYVESPEEISTNPGEVRIKFTNQFFGPFTYGDTFSFDIEEVIFVHPRERPSEIEVKYSIPESYIATVEDRTVTIHGAGPFTIRAETNETGNFISSSGSLIETQVTVLKAVPSLSEPWELFQTALMVGQTVEFEPPTFKLPPPGQSFPSEISSFIYTSSNELIASIPNETSPIVTIKNKGDFYITAKTSESKNYESVSINSGTEYSTTLNTPIIVFPDVSKGFRNEITYGEPYFLKEAEFIYPPPNTIVEGTASLNGTVIQLMSLQKYNQIIINAILTVDTINTPENNTAIFKVTNKYITNNQYFVTVLLVNGVLTNENMTIQNIRQYISSPSGVYITYSIPLPIPLPPLPNPYIPVATISGTIITINRSGSFEICGQTNVTETFTVSDKTYSTIVTVKKATPTIVFENNIFPNDTVLIAGKIYKFKPARIELPSSVPHEDIKVNYTSVPDDIVTILDVTDDYVSILISKSGSFQIKVETVETQNFISTSILSSKEVNVNIDEPLINFPSTFISELTYGFKNPNFPINTYAPEEALFVYPEPNDVPSNLSISYSIPENQKDIATVTLSPVTKTSVLFGDYTKLAPVITIKNTGKFTLIAETSKTSVFKSVSIRREVEVIRATPVLSTPWDLFTGPLQAGETYTFSPPQFISPSPVPNEIPPFTYRSSNELIASIPDKKIPIVTILKQGQFNIIAKTEASENYNEVNIRSSSEYSTNINTPAILFPTDFKKTITYGDPYILKEAYFRYPTTAAANVAGLYITHSIDNSTVATISISGTTNTVTINEAGSFTIWAETNTTDAFEKTSIYESVTVEKATPILKFENDIFPNNNVLFVSKTYEFIPATITFPPNVIPEDIKIIYTCVPSGVVTIKGTTILVNKDASFQINAETVETKNFNKATASSNGERITSFDTPDIYFPQNFTKQITFGQTYTLAPVIFTHPINPAAVGISVTYTILTTESKTESPMASISGTTVTIHKAGTFKISAQTNKTDAFKSFSISEDVEVIRATPEVSTPWNALSLQDIAGLTTNTINDWTIIKVGDTLDYILNLTPTSLRVGTTITITYSTTDSVSGRILNIVGNTLTLSITNVSSVVYSRTNVLYNETSSPSYSSSTGPFPSKVGSPIPANSFVWFIGFNFLSNTINTGGWTASIPSTVNVSLLSGITIIATTTNFKAPLGALLNYPLLGFTSGRSVLYNGRLFSVQYNLVSGSTNNAYGVDSVNGFWLGQVQGYTVPYSTGTITTNNNVFFIGDTLTINPPQFISPALPLRSEILPIQYTYASNNIPGIITITQDTPLVPAYVTVNKIGKFRIIGNTIRSDRFEKREIISDIEYNTELLSPVITFPPDFTKQITFGQTYTLALVIFTYPTNPVAAGISVTYTSTDPTVAIISGTTVTILKSGTFKITALTNQTDAFKSVSLTSDIITVNKATPTIPSSWNAFPTLNTSSPIYVGSVLTITAPLIASPSPIPAEILPITYESNPVDAITIVGTAVTLVKAGQFNLIARTKVSDNYNSVSVNASPITVVNIPPPTIVEQSGTIVWVGEPTIATSPKFVQANPRGTGTEWFAVVDNRSLSEITLYARTNNSSHFTPQGETKPVIFNNIVTTLMTNMSGMFSGASTFNQPISSWDTARVIDMSNMFKDARAFNQSIGSWNTSNVTTMQGMFQNATAFNDPIGSWNTSKVTDMSYMFSGAKFNRVISSWDTARVTNMEAMFQNATAFNQPIGSWNTASVINMNSVFQYATVFNQNIGSWNTASVTSMNSMFFGASAFNQPIGTWNTASVTNINFIFCLAPAFNQPIGTWNTGSVTEMVSVFNTASVFNQPLDRWNTSRVKSMQGMFNSASSFNQPIGSWQTSQVIDMSNMFSDAVAFNQNISYNENTGAWNTSNVTNMSGMFSGATVFNGSIRWITSNVINMGFMFYDASAFNQNVNRTLPFLFSGGVEIWNTGRVTSMIYMFSNAKSFNQPLGNWNTSSVSNMISMFSGASVFNQNISMWNTSALIASNSFANFRSSSPLSYVNTPLRIFQGGW